MDDINKEYLARTVGHDEDSETLKKTARIIKDKRQLSVRIPRRFAELAKINPKINTFEFSLVPQEDGTFTIEADLK